MSSNDEREAGAHLSPLAGNLQGESPSLMETLKVLYLRRRRIFLITLVTTSVAVLYALLATPVYRVSVVMTPVETDQSQGGLSGLVSQYGDLAAMAGINISGASSSTDEAIATLKSRALTERFFVARDVVSSLSKSSTFSLFGFGGSKSMSPSEAFRKFDEKIRSVVRQDDTGLVILSITWRDASQAVEWANGLVSQVNDYLRAEALRESEAARRTLTGELGQTDVVEVRAGIYRLIESEIKRSVIARVREQYAFRVIDPAAIPDSDEYVQPKRPMIVGFGLIAGFVLGIATVLLAESIQSVKQALGRTESD